MTDEIHETEVVEVTETVGVARTTTVTSESAIDWDTLPAYDESAVQETEVLPAAGPDVSDVATYYAPRSAWDFTESQRIVLSFLIWLNILVIVVGYLAFTGQIYL